MAFTRKLPTELTQGSDKAYLTSMDRYYCPNCGEFAIIASPATPGDEEVTCRICQQRQRFGAVTDRMKQKKLKPKKAGAD
jgi:hypothetical protein